MWWITYSAQCTEEEPAKLVEENQRAAWCVNFVKVPTASSLVLNIKLQFAVITWKTHNCAHKENSRSWKCVKKRNHADTINNVSALCNLKNLDNHLGLGLFDFSTFFFLNLSYFQRKNWNWTNGVMVVEFMTSKPLWFLKSIDS